jgi:hypothetical protein
MKTYYLLIDYENVQPKSLEVLNGHPVRVIAFVGANQARVPVEFACSLQALGNAAQYVQISDSGRNAVDFRIVFALGQLSNSQPDAYFHVISKDTGFDPLLKHLRGSGLLVQRFEEIADIPLLKIANAGSTAERLGCIVSNLQSRGNAKPRKLKTLASTINALFQKALQPAELRELIEALQQEGYITLDGEAVTYHLSPA